MSEGFSEEEMKGFLKKGKTYIMVDEGAFDRDARIAAAAEWYVECSRLYETLIEYHIKPPFNPNGFDEILNIYLQARAALKQAVKGGLNE